MTMRPQRVVLIGGGYANVRALRDCALPQVLAAFEFWISVQAREPAWCLP